jgi:xanthine dehydrogenase molybdopterin-binding subunit B
MITNNFTDYKIPTFKDLPGEIVLDVVETPQLDGPYGARGAGEHPLISVTAVMANAVANATGVQFHDLPLSASRVFTKYQELRAGEAGEIAEGMEHFVPRACTANACATDTDTIERGES